MHLILLHGAISSAHQFENLSIELSRHYKLHPVNFTGHGGSDLTGVFSMATFARQIAEYIDEHLKNEDVNILGYSMGGYVAMFIAKHYPGKVNKIITLATKFYWNEAVAAKEVLALQPDVIETKVPAFAKKLSQIHQPQDWKMVLSKTADMLKQMGTENPLKLDDYSGIQTGCLLLVGDRDKIVTVHETEEVFKQLPNASFGVLPSTTHPLEQADNKLLSFIIHRFLMQKP